jgi:hypothetical protein
MHLRGHDSNHDLPLGIVLEWVSEALSVRPRRPVTALPRAKRLCNSVVQRAVIEVLAATDRALSVADVQCGVEERLGGPVSKDSVRSCLSTGARGGEPCFRRIVRGRYQLLRSLGGASRPGGDASALRQTTVRAASTDALKSTRGQHP